MSDEEIWLQLVSAEYQSLREESSQARQAQQSTLTWSVAALGTVLAGGLVFVSGIFAPGAKSSMLSVLFYALVFGLALPGYAFFAALTYMGELGRMTRVGAYLQGLERFVATMISPAPLRWETGLNAKRGAKGRTSRLLSPVVGSLALYFGSLVISLIAFWSGVTLYRDQAPAFVALVNDTLAGPPFDQGAPVVDLAAFKAGLPVGTWVWAIGVVALFVVFMLVLGLLARHRGRKRIEYDEIDPLT